MNHQRKPLISVVTVCYNAVNEIEKTMLSVLNQTYDNIEYIVIDGGSKDGTVDIIKKHEHRLAYWVSEPDGGIFFAMNKSLNHVTGNWIIFMNAGDILVDNHVIESSFEKEYDDQVGVVFGTTMTVKGEMRMLPFIYSNKKYKPMGICHQSLFVRSELAKDIKFDLSYKVAADYNMIMQIYKKAYCFIDLKMPVSMFDLTGYSAQNSKAQMEEVAKICGATTSFGYKRSLFVHKIKKSIKSLICK